MRGPTMRELQDPLLRGTERHEWSICREPGCDTRVRREYRCEEHRETDELGRSISTLKRCRAEGCYDVLPKANPRSYCGLHEDQVDPLTLDELLGRKLHDSQATLEVFA